MRADLRDIINCLNVNKVRATYDAVAGVLRVPPVGVGAMLGECRPELSWIVDRETGRPRGYTIDALHPELFAHRLVISAPLEQDQLVRNSR